MTADKKHTLIRYFEQERGGRPIVEFLDRSPLVEYSLQSVFLPHSKTCTRFPLQMVDIRLDFLRAIATHKQDTPKMCTLVRNCKYCGLPVKYDVERLWSKCVWCGRGNLIKSTQLHYNPKTWEGLKFEGSIVNSWLVHFQGSPSIYSKERLIVDFWGLFELGVAFENHVREYARKIWKEDPTKRNLDIYNEIEKRKFLVVTTEEGYQKKHEVVVPRQPVEKRWYKKISCPMKSANKLKSAKNSTEKFIDINPYVFFPHHMKKPEEERELRKPSKSLRSLKKDAEVTTYTIFNYKQKNNEVKFPKRYSQKGRKLRKIKREILKNSISWSFRVEKAIFKHKSNYSRLSRDKINKFLYPKDMTEGLSSIIELRKRTSMPSFHEEVFGVEGKPQHSSFMKITEEWLKITGQFVDIRNRNCKRERDKSIFYTLNQSLDDFHAINDYWFISPDSSRFSKYIDKRTGDKDKDLELLKKYGYKVTARASYDIKKKANLLEIPCWLSPNAMKGFYQLRNSVVLRWGNFRKFLTHYNFDRSNVIKKVKDKVRYKFRKVLIDDLQTQINLFYKDETEYPIKITVFNFKLLSKSEFDYLGKAYSLNEHSTTEKIIAEKDLRYSVRQTKINIGTWMKERDRSLVLEKIAFEFIPEDRMTNGDFLLSRPVHIRGYRSKNFVVLSSEQIEENIKKCAEAYDQGLARKYILPAGEEVARFGNRESYEIADYIPDINERGFITQDMIVDEVPEEKEPLMKDNKRTCFFTKFNFIRAMTGLKTVKYKDEGTKGKTFQFTRKDAGDEFSYIQHNLKRKRIKEVPDVLSTRGEKLYHLHKARKIRDSEMRITTFNDYLWTALKRYGEPKVSRNRYFPLKYHIDKVIKIILRNMKAKKIKGKPRIIRFPTREHEEVKFAKKKGYEIIKPLLSADEWRSLMMKLYKDGKIKNVYALRWGDEYEDSWRVDMYVQWLQKWLKRYMLNRIAIQDLYNKLKHIQQEGSEKPQYVYDLDISKVYAVNDEGSQDWVNRVELAKRLWKELELPFEIDPEKPNQLFLDMMSNLEHAKRLKRLDDNKRWIPRENRKILNVYKTLLKSMEKT